MCIDAYGREERLERAFALEECMDGFVDLTLAAGGVDLVAEAHAYVFVHESARCVLEDGLHVLGDGVGPRVPVVPCRVSRQVTPVGCHRGAFGCRQENICKGVVDGFDDIDRVGRCVNAQVARAQRELSSVVNADGGKARCFHAIE